MFNILKLLINFFLKATQQKRKDKVLEFFETFGAELNGNPEWSKWFGSNSFYIVIIILLEMYF